jgi:hypothetical protein
MAYPISAKAIAIAHNLASNLTQRFSTDASLSGSANGVVEGFDSNGNPTIKAGSGTATQANFFIRVEPQAWGGTDVLGNASNIFTPTVIQIAWEAVSGAGANPLSVQEKISLLGESLPTGCRVEVWESATGIAPTVTTLGTPSNRQAVFESLQYPLVGNV